MNATGAAPLPHLLNVNFQWRDAAPEALLRLSPLQLSEFNNRGFTVLRAVFSAEELDKVEAAIDPLERHHERLLREPEASNAISSADAITFTTHLVKRSTALREFAAHPAIVAACHDLIGGDVRLYWDQSVYKKSGVPQEFPWHQDNGYAFVEPQQYLTIWIPLVDVDIDNGCPWIAPGLHKLGTFSHWVTPIGLKCLNEAPDAIPAPAKRGDAIIFSSLAPHRTGPNLRPGTVRKAYILQYAPDGAQAITPEGARIALADEGRQFLILKDGSCV